MILQALSPELVSFLRRSFARVLLVLTALGIAGAQQSSQPSPPPSSHERTYTQSKIAVEKALKELQTSLSGRLPVLDGFAIQGEYPLSRYQRGYYQSTVHVSASSSGGSLVRVNTKVTAWYADSSPARSGYKVLASNGRLESDLLDQLDELLATNGNANGNSSAKSSLDFNTATSPPAGESETLKTSRNTSNSDKKTSDQKMSREAGGDPLISAPRSSETDRTFSSALTPGRPTDLTGQPRAEIKSPTKTEDRSATALQAEAASLEEVLKNQARPKNLVAIKKSGTPVVSTPSLNGKTLFLASAQDEFEMLDFNADWVHVRVSGLSRGWIWRTSLEMPQGISDIPKANATGAPAIAVADLFQVTREETAPFPGDWEPLRNKTVKIVSVQKIQENEKNSGAEAKLEYSKSLLDKNYAELADKGRDLAGIVLIFDSVDGGMIAATVPTVRAWKAGTLSDSALWHQCYFDPPETFTVSSNPANGH
jgi:DNA-binding transcriptional regulator YdaS (Cro superfamily)